MAATPPPPPPPSQQQQRQQQQRRQPSGQWAQGPETRPRKAKELKTAAVVLTCPEGQYGSTIAEMRRCIRLVDLGIEGVNTLRAMTGTLVLEISGEGDRGKAYALAARMSGLLEGRDDVRVSRPEMTANL